MRTEQVALTVVDQLRGRRVAPLHFHLVFVADEELIELEWVLQPRMHGTFGFIEENEVYGVEVSFFSGANDSLFGNSIVVGS